MNPRSRPARLIARLFDPIDACSLAAFRAAFGLLVALRAAWYLLSGNLDLYYQADLLFHYSWAPWVTLPPAPWLHLLMLGVLLAALALAAGALTRVSAAAVALGLGYFHLLDKSTHGSLNNLAIYLSVLLVFVPTHRALSLDVGRGLTRGDERAPAWGLWILRLQVGVMYLFAGLVKLSGEWLAGEPVRTWMRDRHLGGPLEGLMTHEAAVMSMVWGGLLFDLLIVPLLLWRRTRPLGIVLLFAFHGGIMLALDLGQLTPILIVLTLLLFLPPQATGAWTRRLAGKPAYQVALEGQPPWQRPAPGQRRAVVAALGLWAVLQLVVPLRHLATPGDDRWTYEAQPFSWWMRSFQMDLDARFHVQLDGGPRQRIDPMDYIHHNQTYFAFDPDMVLQFARHVAADYRARGHQQVAVYVDASGNLLGAPRQRFLPTGVDLASYRGDPYRLVVPKVSAP